jgi:hypothetical protein
MHTPASGTEVEQPRFDRDIEQQDTPIKPEDFVTHNGLLLVCPFYTRGMPGSLSVASCRPCLSGCHACGKRLVTTVRDLLDTCLQVRPYFFDFRFHVKLRHVGRNIIDIISGVGALLVSCMRAVCHMCHTA